MKYLTHNQWDKLDKLNDRYSKDYTIEPYVGYYNGVEFYIKNTDKLLFSMAFNEITYKKIDNQIAEYKEAK